MLEKLNPDSQEKYFSKLEAPVGPWREWMIFLLNILIQFSEKYFINISILRVDYTESPTMYHNIKLDVIGEKLQNIIFLTFILVVMIIKTL